MHHQQQTPAVSARPGVSIGDLEHLHRVFFCDLHLCGCGHPDQVWPMLHALLRVMDTRDADCHAQIAALIGTGGACHMVLSMLTEAGLIEHGGNIWVSWLAVKGRWVLAAMQALGCLDEQGVDDLFDDLQIGLPHDGGPCTAQCWAVPPGQPALAGH